MIAASGRRPWGKRDILRGHDLLGKVPCGCFYNSRTASFLVYIDFLTFDFLWISYSLFKDWGLEFMCSCVKEGKVRNITTSMDASYIRLIFYPVLKAIIQV